MNAGGGNGGGREVKVGINGFGRIGRSLFRILADRPGFSVVAVNDLFDNQQLAYLLKYDTVMDIFDREVSADQEAMYVAGERVEMTAERDPAAIPWGELGVEVVIESTGVFRHREQLEKHLAAGARRVVLMCRPRTRSTPRW